jgi:hypothetical protein
MRGAPFQPKNHSPLQIFKERILTDIRGAAKSVSYITGIYRLETFSSEVRPFGDDQR